ncbi:hypothetical protein JW890_06615 [candidate division WOR-3 bacterium]|nr:hypothetical protein [candidate division WOR-3 bacterium]
MSGEQHQNVHTDCPDNEKQGLTKKDEVFIEDTIKWDGSSKTFENIIYRAIIFLGVVSLLVITYFSIINFSDKTLLFITVPGILMSVLLVIIGFFGDKKVSEKHNVARIFKILYKKSPAQETQQRGENEQI